MSFCQTCLNDGCTGNHLESTERFAMWMHGRGCSYAGLKLHNYMDGQPYFSSQGAEMSLSDFLRREKELTAPLQLSLL
jgi:hypothetical protein